MLGDFSYVSDIPERDYLINVYNFASKAHIGQCRKVSGNPYIEHPYRCGKKAYEFFTKETWRNLTATEANAIMLCHDLKEDCQNKYIEEDLYDLIGHRCYMYVIYLSSLPHLDSMMSTLNRKTRRHITANRLADISGTVRALPYLKIIDMMDNLQSSSGDYFFEKKYPLEIKDTLLTMCSNLMDNIGNSTLYIELQNELAKKNIAL